MPYTLSLNAFFKVNLSRQETLLMHTVFVRPKFLHSYHATNLSTGNIKGEESVHLCPDGLVFDIKSERCDYPAKVDCTGRPQLRKSKFSIIK